MNTPANQLSQPKTLLRSLYEAFRSIHGWPVTALAFLFAVFAPAVLPEATVPIRYLYFPAGLGVILLITLAEALASTRRQVTGLSATVPRHTFDVIRSRRPDNDPEHGVQLLLRCGSALGFDSYVSVYSVADNDFEVLLGLGVVRNIQESGLAQIDILAWLANKAADLDKILTNDPKVLAALRVKASASREFLTLEYPPGFGPIIPIPDEN